ncbi:hypothetical protein AA313_de0204032 [Arthrobotrys entomopaga]|nr:hypothetical protein AA313_de0204032 [Arthrobotrys entomopaga]
MLPLNLNISGRLSDITKIMWVEAEKLLLLHVVLAVNGVRREGVMRADEPAFESTDGEGVGNAVNRLSYVGINMFSTLSARGRFRFMSLRRRPQVCTNAGAGMVSVVFGETFVKNWVGEMPPSEVFGCSGAQGGVSILDICICFGSTKPSGGCNVIPRSCRQNPESVSA